MLAVALALLFSAAATGRAHQVLGSVSLGGGVATDQRGVRSNAATVAPSVLFLPDPRLSVGLAGSYTRFQGRDWAAAGGANAGMRLPLAGPLALAASASAGLTKTSFDASYVTVEATPTLEATVGQVTVFGGARVAQCSTTISQALSGSPTTAPRSVSLTRSSVGPVFGAVLGVPTDRPDVGGSIGYREERARVEQVSVTDRALTGSVTSGFVLLSASAGMRSAPDERVQFASVGATVGIGRAFALAGSVGSYPSSRTLGTLGGQYASLGVVLRGRTNVEDSPAQLVVRSAPRLPAGVTRLAIRAPGATRVELAGDWNDWSPTPATRAADDIWYADIRLAPGEHRYAFRVDGRRWQVPEGAPSVDDGFGGRSALVVVP